MKRDHVKARLLAALKTGPLYFGAMPIVIGATEQELRGALADLHAAGQVERAPEIGPQTFRLAAGAGDTE